jgi:hypothetical protein
MTLHTRSTDKQSTSHLSATAHHAWRCPKCGAEYHSHLPVVAVSHACRLAPGRQTQYVPVDEVTK